MSDSWLYGIKAERIGHHPFHLSRNLRLIYVLEGSVALHWVSGVHTLKEGEIEIININEPVEMRKTSSENLVLLFEINGARAKKYCDMIDRGIYNCNTTLFYTSVTATADQDVLKGRLRLLYHYYLADAGDFLAEKAVGEIVHFIGEHCHDMRNMFRNAMGDDVREERFLRIYTYILENCHKKINLKNLADGEFLSPQYLSKEFNDKLKINFKDTLAYFRVIQSVRYLITSSMSVTQISEQCGFSAPRYFYKYFAHYLNCTPMEFKGMYLNRKEECQAFPINHSYVECLVRAYESEAVRYGARQKEVGEMGCGDIPERIFAEILREAGAEEFADRLREAAKARGLQAVITTDPGGDADPETYIREDRGILPLFSAALRYPQADPDREADEVGGETETE
ncbi:helix-turn-helix transcriptional regulator [Bacilliculturomica massiliensis]|uniref:helix-turn-helix transcriptional regulator n=1 Tax=Bacilliculturomica massiliensis TaxID=1917867 RepID=UPI00102FE13A|nr:helix-turn-helix transcriptional regulator [Bacilliculturomica massiliensis]